MNLPSSISSVLSNHLVSPPASKWHSTPWQVEGSRIAHKLGATEHKDYGMVIRLVKMNYSIAQQAYSFAVDSIARSRLHLFYWKFWQILRTTKKA